MGMKWYLIVILICIFLMFNECWAYFPVLISYLYVFFGEKSILVLCPLFNQMGFFWLILSCRSSLVILNINPLPHIWFANMFLHSMSCLCILLTASFDAHNFKFWCSLIYIFFFWCLFLWCHVKKLLPNSMLWRSSPMFSPRVLYF